MTINETIEHYEDIVESLKQQFDQCDIDDRFENHIKVENSKHIFEYEQLIKWLKELKELRAKVTHSKWISKYDDKHGFHYICGNCNAISGARTTFCFDCGADMKKEC